MRLLLSLGAGMMAMCHPASAMVLDCTVEKTCANINQCREAAIPARIEQRGDQIVMNLGADDRDLASQKTSGDVLLRGYTNSPDGKNAYLLSLYGTLLFTYTVHTHVEQGVTLNMFGRCQRKTG